MKTVSQIKPSPPVKEKVDESQISSKLEGLKSDAQGEENSGGFMSPGKKRGPKKGVKYGPRPSKDASAPNNIVGENGATPNAVQDIEQVKKILTPVFQTCSAIGVKMAETPEAAMGAVELEIMVDSAARCVNQYLPGVLGAHASLIVLTLTFSQWSLKVYLLREAKLQEMRAKQAMKMNSEVNAGIINQSASQPTH